MALKVTFLLLGVCASAAFAASVGGGGSTPPQGAIFNVTTLEWISGNTLAPAVGSDLSGLPSNDGFSFTGLATFTADSDSETVSMQAEEQFTAPLGGYDISIWSGAYFGSNDPSTSAVLDSYTAVSSILETGGSATETLSGAWPIPYSSGYPQSLYVTGSAASPIFLSGTGPYYTLDQLVTISFSGLTPGEVISVDFPSGSTVDPAPEPGTMLLGASATLGIVLLRRRALR
jgi:hypothetical protein